jgi:hypothetical protein
MSLKEECPERMIVSGEESLRQPVRQFLGHYHGERNHQGLGKRPIDAAAEVGRGAGEVHCRERLGGILHYYYSQVVRPHPGARLGNRLSGYEASLLRVRLVQQGLHVGPELLECFLFVGGQLGQLGGVAQAN